jgi:hemerythrin-like metal-binding protein
MPLVEWREEFNLGVASVDHEHQELIALINKVHDRIAEPGSDVTIAEYLGEIYARIAAHFALEERIMRETGYDQYAGHKADHERLLDDIRDIMDDYEAATAPTDMTGRTSEASRSTDSARDPRLGPIGEDRALFNDKEFGERLAKWFTDHFKTHDARLHHHLPH